MGLHKPFDRFFWTIDGKTKTSGGALTLAKGQLALVDTTKATQTGAKVVSSLVGAPKNKKNYALRLGISDNAPNRSYSNHAKSTLPFSLEEVIGVRVSAPKTTEQSVDEVVLGYDGITPGSGFSFKTGDRYFEIAVEVSGDPISYLGGGLEAEVVVVRVEVPDCDPFNTCEDCDNCATVDCKAITIEAIDRLRRKQLSGGALLSDVVDITPVFSCDNDVTATLIPHTFYTLNLCDTGTDSALAVVQAMYNYKVVRTARHGSTSTYSVLLPDTAGAPAAFVQTIGSFIKGCDVCPAGYTASPEGILYTFTIEDDGSDQSALISALPNYVATTVVKSGNENGVGFYTAVFSQELTDAQIAAFVGGAAPRNTATVNMVGPVAAICEPNAQPAGIAWVAGDTCNAVTEDYEIILVDDKCGDDRLEELQSAYPWLTIAVADSPNSTRTVTLVGSSGSTDIIVDGVTYTATYAASVTATASAFVTANSADLLADGVTVTSNAGVITFTGPTAIINAITIANTTMTSTLQAAAVLPYRQACQTKYTTTVTSNLVCEECDPIFNDYYSTSAPDMFDNESWVKVVDTTTQPNGNCECGIRIKGKTFHLVGEEALRDLVGFTEASTLIRASAQYPEEIREGIGRLPKGINTARYFSRYKKRTHLGGNMLEIEKEGEHYFRGTSYKEYLGRVLRGETSSIEDQLVQYVDYVITVRSSKHTQGFASVTSEDIEYHIYAPVGKHQNVENLVNMIAAGAGQDPVQAFGA